MKITWKRCLTYEEAKDHHRVIYLHEWDDKPFYWGKAHNSFFGGGKRKIGDLFASGRYNSGYRHWIEGCLRHGAKLYIGQLSDLALTNIDDVEKHLLNEFGHEVNKRVITPSAPLDIEHLGEIPASIVMKMKGTKIGLRSSVHQHQLLRIARHEAAHFVVAEAMGFSGQRISIHYQDATCFHGKVDQDLTDHCRSLDDVKQYATRRVITLMAGAIGEALDSNGLINASEAGRVFEGADTGAGIDRSTSHEFIHLIHHISEPGSLSLIDVKNQVWKLAMAVTCIHAVVIESVAQALLATIDLKPDGLHMELTNQQIENLLGQRIPRVDDQLDAFSRKIGDLKIQEDVSLKF